MPKKQKSADVPPYVLQKAQKAYERLLAAQHRLANEPPENPAKNISIELEPALLQAALSRAIEQLVVGQEPVLKLEVNLPLIPDELLKCIEQCFQDKSANLASSIYSSDVFKLGAWSKSRSQTSQEASVKDIQSQIAEMLNQATVQDEEALEDTDTP